jgi:hypothetical protein
LSDSDLNILKFCEIELNKMASPGKPDEDELKAIETMQLLFDQVGSADIDPIVRTFILDQLNGFDAIAASNWRTCSAETGARIHRQ